MTQKECERCGKTKSYNLYYFKEYDLYVCNDCLRTMQEAMQEEYAKARFEQEHDL